MNPYLVLVLVMLLFILLWGSLSLLRREPLSARLAIEALLFGGVILGVGGLLQSPPAPVLFFVALYVFTMRVRLLVDIGNALARRGRLAAASHVYMLALRIATVPADRLIVLANEGAALLLGGQVPEAIAVLQEVLAPGASPGIKLEAACRCNLGLAYLRQGQLGLGRGQLREAIDLLPGSIYAQRARHALERLEASD